MKDLSIHIKSFKEIADEYEFTLRSIESKLSFYSRVIKRGRRVPSPISYYFSATPVEVNAIRYKLKLEVERKFTLELTSAFEAKTVYYFRNIIKRKKTLYKAYQSNVSASVRRGVSHLMYQHILMVFKQEIQPIDNIAYANFKNLIEYRNWLAHGRGWSLDDHLNKFDFEYSYLTIERIITFMPSFPDSLRRTN